VAASNPIVHAVTEAARRAVHADAARVVRSGDEQLVVAAVAYSGQSPHEGFSISADSEGVGYVLASAQPLSVAASGAGGRPALCVPCTLEGEPIAALELLGRPGQDAFPIEATEIAMLFGGIAATAMGAADPAMTGVSSPRELATELERLDASDPARYASVARAVSALLA
jgi:hypothetical protein